MRYGLLALLALMALASTMAADPLVKRVKREFNFQRSAALAVRTPQFRACSEQTYTPPDARATRDPEDIAACPNPDAAVAAAHFAVNIVQFSGDVSEVTSRHKWHAQTWGTMFKGAFDAITDKSDMGAKASPTTSIHFGNSWRRLQQRLDISEERGMNVKRYSQVMRDTVSWSSTAEEFWESSEAVEDVEVVPSVPIEWNAKGKNTGHGSHLLGVVFKNVSTVIPQSGVVHHTFKGKVEMDLPAMGLDVSLDTSADLLQTALAYFVAARTPILVRLPLSLSDEQWASLVTVVNAAAKDHPACEVIVAVGEDFGKGTVDVLDEAHVNKRVESLSAKIALLELHALSENGARTVAALDFLAALVAAGKGRALTVGAAPRRWQLKHYAKEARTKPIGVSFSGFTVFSPGMGALSTQHETPLKFVAKRQLLPIVRGILTHDTNVDLMDPREEQRAEEIAERLDVTGAEVTMRWAMQMGLLPLAPLATTDDAKFCDMLATSVLKFKLREDDMALLNMNALLAHRRPRNDLPTRPFPQLFAENEKPFMPPEVNGTVHETHHHMGAHIRWYDPERPPRGTIGHIEVKGEHDVEVRPMQQLLKSFGMGGEPEPDIDDEEL